MIHSLKGSCETERCAKLPTTDILREHGPHTIVFLGTPWLCPGKWVFHRAGSVHFGSEGSSDPSHGSRARYLLFPHLNHCNIGVLSPKAPSLLCQGTVW